MFDNSQFLPECFLIGQFASRLTMGRLLDIEESEIVMCKKYGKEFLLNIKAPQNITEIFDNISFIPEATSQSRAQLTEQIELRLATFLQVFMDWLKEVYDADNIKAFNLGFCSFLAIFYSNLFISGKERTYSALKDAVITVFNLATELGLQNKEISEAHLMVQADKSEVDAKNISHLMIKFFSTALKDLGGFHLTENADFLYDF